MLRKIITGFMFLPMCAALASPIDPVLARRQLRDQILSALDAIELQAKETASSDVFNETSAGMMLGVMIIPILFQVFGDEEDTGLGVVKRMLKANVLDHVFDERQMLAQNESTLSFKLREGLCDKFALLTGNFDTTKINRCRDFLIKNQVALNLVQRSKSETQVQVHFNANDPINSEFVTALDVAPTSLGLELNLSQVRSMLAALRDAAIVDHDGVLELDTFSGLVKVGVGFKNGSLASRCSGSGGICFLVDVLKSVQITSSVGMEGFHFEAHATGQGRGAFEIAANGNAAFLLSLNLGRVLVNFGEDFAFNMPALKGGATIPRGEGEGKSYLRLMNVSFGEGPVTISKGQSFFSVDLNKDSDRVVKALSLIWDEIAGVFLETSGMDLRLRVLDNESDSCTAIEEAQFKFSPGRLMDSRIRVGQNTPRDLGETEPCSLADKLQFFMFNLLQKSACNEASAIEAIRGTFDFEHNYVVKNESGKASLHLSEGECAQFLNSPENRDEL